MMDRAVEGAEPFHARAGRTDQQDGGLAVLQVVQEVGRVARYEEVNAAHDVEVRPTTVSSFDQKFGSVTGSCTELRTT